MLETFWKRYPMCKMNTIFKKGCCPPSQIRHEKKTCMRQHTIFRNYCHYYNHHDCSNDSSYSHLAIVVTTVVTENRMPTHAIFILM